MTVVLFIVGTILIMLGILGLAGSTNDRILSASAFILGLVFIVTTSGTAFPTILGWLSSLAYNVVTYILMFIVGILLLSFSMHTIEFSKLLQEQLLTVCGVVIGSIFICGSAFYTIPYVANALGLYTGL